MYKLIRAKPRASFFRQRNRLFPVRMYVAGTLGELTAKAKKQADGFIAATALTCGLHVMTENVRDFEPAGALVFNPYRQEQQ